MRNLALCLLFAAFAFAGGLIVGALNAGAIAPSVCKCCGLNPKAHCPAVCPGDACCPCGDDCPCCPCCPGHCCKDGGHHEKK